MKLTNEEKIILLLGGFARELEEGSKTYEELNYEYAHRILKICDKASVSEESKNLSCPFCTSNDLFEFELKHGKCRSCQNQWTSSI